MVKFEVLVTENQTVLKSFFIKDSSNPVIKTINNKTIVYSDLLDECLNVDSFEIVEDLVSKLFIFKLSSNMYTMSECHSIGLKNYDDAYLLVEIFENNRFE